MDSDNQNNGQTQLILGYGTIGQAVAKELAKHNINYRIAARTAIDVPQYVQADASQLQSLIAATADVSHVYVVLGLAYDVTLWKSQWPVIMQNVIQAAKINNFKIVFFDNIYMYGPAPLQNPITEDHPQFPTSKKGAVRKEIADMLLKATAGGEVQAVIGRCADFYGPHVVNGLLYANTLQRMLKGKKAQFIGNPSTLHSYTYTLDAANGLVRLGLDDTSYGQVWHLPTAQPARTTTDLLNSMATMVGAPTDVSVMPKPLVSILKNFVPILKEVDEMTYQTDVDYVFSSDKFMRAYPDFQTTRYEDGLKATVDSFIKRSV